PDGEVTAAIRGLECRRVSANELGKRLGRGAPDWSYQVAWRPESGSARLPDVCRIVDGLDAVAMQSGSLQGLPRYEPLFESLDPEITASIVSAFRGLGFRFEPGRRLAVDELASELGVAAKRRRWFERLLGVLHDAGVLSVRDGAVEVLRSPEERQADFGSIRARFPEFDPEVLLTARCAPAFGAVLRGERDPLDLLFPNGSSEAAERLYVHSVSAKAYNAV